MGSEPLIELIALSIDDAKQASEAGAHRIELVGTMECDGLAPAPQLVEHVVSEVQIRVRPMVRLDAGFDARSDDLPKLKALVRDFCSAGAEGVVFGYLNPSGDLAVDYMCELAAELSNGCAFTIHRAVDAASDYCAAWEQILAMPIMPDVVLTAGSPAGIGVGAPNLAAVVKRHPEAVDLIQAGGGMKREHVAGLSELGVRQFHIGSGVRENGTFASPISAVKVQEWLRACRAEQRREVL